MVGMSGNTGIIKVMVFSSEAVVFMLHKSHLWPGTCQSTCLLLQQQEFCYRLEPNRQKECPAAIYLRFGKRLALSDLALAKLLQADSLDGDEAGGVHGGEGRERVHGRVLLAVEVARLAAATEGVGVALWA